MNAVETMDSVAKDLAKAEEKLQEFLFSVMSKSEWVKYQDLLKVISNKEKAFVVAREALHFNSPAVIKGEYVTISASNDFKIDRGGLIDSAVNGNEAVAEFVQPYVKVIVRKNKR